MNVPLLDLKKQYSGIKDEIRAAIDEVLDSQRFISGPKVEELERKIADYCDVKHAIGVSSGTDALLVSLMALGIGQGDKVITTAYSFFSTAGVIARIGAVPVFVDIEPLTYNIDPVKLEKLLKKGDKYKAIIPVHLYGQCADMDSIMRLAEEYELKVIEDAAQAIGAKYRGRPAGTLGHTGCFSFFPSKNLGGYGDGGMVVTKDAGLAEKLKILRVHGAKPKYYHSLVGGNFRLDALQAAVLLVKLNYLNEWSKRRRENAETYNRLFQEAGLTEELKLPYSAPDNFHIFNQYIIRVPQRDSLKQFLKERGIATEIYYPVPLHLQECFSYLGGKKGDFPESERAAEETIALPIYPELTSAQQEYIVTRIGEFYGKPA